MQMELTRLCRVDHPKVKAVASILIEGVLAIHDIKVLEGRSGLWIAMPNKPDIHGRYRDMVHPIHAALRQQIEQLIIGEYEKQQTLEV